MSASEMLDERAERAVAGTLLLDPFGQSQLGNENLARLGQHPLFARRQPALTLTAPQVANDLCHLHHVARVELLQVRLVTTRPVGRLLGVRGTQHLEHLVEAFLAHHVANTDVLSVFCGYSNGQIALRNLEDEIFFLLAFDGPGFNRLDQCCTVVWVNDGVSDLENHQIRAPFT